MHLYCTLVGRPRPALYPYSPPGAGQPRRDGGGRSEAGSLAGAVASKKVTEACTRHHSIPLGQCERCRAAGPTRPAGVARAAGHSDPTHPLGRGVD